MATKFLFEAEPFDSYVLYPRFEEIPLSDQQEEVDLFLGKLVRRAARVAKNIGRTAQQAAKTVGRTATKVSRAVPLSQVADLASRITPLGTLGRAAWGGLSVGLKGQNVLHGAVRSSVSGPVDRFVFDTGLGVARGENIARAMRKGRPSGYQRRARTTSIRRDGRALAALSLAGKRVLHRMRR